VNAAFRYKFSPWMISHPHAYVQMDDECCFCEGGCARWLHTWYVFFCCRLGCTEVLDRQVHWVRIESQCSGQIALTISRYHSTSDKRLPAKFICIDCRLRADISWELIKSGVYPQVMTKYRDLALFRHVMNILLCNH